MASIVWKGTTDVAQVVLGEIVLTFSNDVPVEVSPNEIVAAVRTKLLALPSTTSVSLAGAIAPEV